VARVKRLGRSVPRMPQRSERSKAETAARQARVDPVAVPRRDKRGVVTAEVRAARDGGERFSWRFDPDAGLNVIATAKTWTNKREPVKLHRSLIAGGAMAAVTSVQAGDKCRAAPRAMKASPTMSDRLKA